MTETLANWYSNESARRELSNEYQHDRAGMVFKSFNVLALRTKVASALKGLSSHLPYLELPEAFSESLGL